MSKRISNSRINRMRPGKLAAHFGRIRYGWRAIALKTKLENIEERLQDEKLEDSIRVRYENFKISAKQMLPKKLLRRTQIR